MLEKLYRIQNRRNTSKKGRKVLYVMVENSGQSAYRTSSNQRRGESSGGGDAGVDPYANMLSQDTLSQQPDALY